MGPESLAHMKSETDSERPPAFSAGDSATPSRAELAAFFRVDIVTVWQPAEVTVRPGCQYATNRQGNQFRVVSVGRTAPNRCEPTTKPYQRNALAYIN